MSKRNSAEAFTSSTPWLVGRGEGYWQGQRLSNPADPGP